MTRRPCAIHSYVMAVMPDGRWFWINAGWPQTWLPEDCIKTQHVVHAWWTKRGSAQ